MEVALSLLTLSLLLLASSTSAEQKSLTVGPYNISFDLGNIGPYTTNISENKSNILLDITGENLY